jgi:hypothetical protein
MVGETVRKAFAVNCAVLSYIITALPKRDKRFQSFHKKATTFACATNSDAFFRLASRAHSSYNKDGSLEGLLAKSGTAVPKAGGALQALQEEAIGRWRSNLNR